MTKGEGDAPTAEAKALADRKQERLAQALRANLQRRKDQARGRDAAPPQSHEDRQR